MRKIVLRFGLASGALLVTFLVGMLVLYKRDTSNFDHSEVVGYSTMVLSLLLVFFGVRSYRDTVAGGTISFGKALGVGLLITVVACAMYVIAWEIAYFNFFPDFLDHYSAQVLAEMRAAGESPAAIQKTTEQMTKMAKLYQNPLFNAAITFMEPFPVGLILSLVSAAILRRKPPQETPAEAVTA